jgi:hypothetical protein
MGLLVTQSAQVSKSCFEAVRLQDVHLESKCPQVQLTL